MSQNESYAQVTEYSVKTYEKNNLDIGHIDNEKSANFQKSTT